MPDPTSLPVEVSTNLSLDLPNATIGASRLRDVQRIKSALSQIDAIISGLPDFADIAASTEVTSAVDAKVVDAINALKSGVVSSADNLFKIKSYIDDLESSIVAINSDISAVNDSLLTKAGVNHTHTFTKSDVGLGNVDNTSDLSKPISTATQAALNGKSDTGHTHTKAAIGLGNVDNTSDLSKPISTATQTALNTKVSTSLLGMANGIATLGVDGKIPSVQLPSYVDDVIEGSTLSAFPATGESGKIYIALDTDLTYRWSGSTYTQITSGSVASVAGKTGVVTLVKADVGLNNVDNTSDLAKPISTATATALSGKSDATHTHTFTKSDVGLGNVDNTSDLAKPISTATQTALNNKADLSSTQTLSNKTLSNTVFSDGYTEEYSSNSTTSNYTVDLANGTVQELTLTANCTFVFPVSTTPGKSFTLLLKQDSTGNRTVTWPSNVSWPGGTTPSITATANKKDKIIFTSDGVNWLGSIAGQNY